MSVDKSQLENKIKDSKNIIALANTAENKPHKSEDKSKKAFVIEINFPHRKKSIKAPSGSNDDALYKSIRNSREKINSAENNESLKHNYKKTKTKQNKNGFISELRYDIDAIMERDPAARSRAEVVLLYSGLHALIAYRAAHSLHKNGMTFLARLISQSARFMTGIEIHPGAEIGKGLFIDHGSGVVIGETTIIGNNCTLYQGVTLGGTGKEVGKRHPTLGNNVMVGAGAKLLGAFTVGDNSKIAAGAVVLRDVPPDSTAVGIPAKIVIREGRRTDVIDLDQTHIPDPISQELQAINKKLLALEERLNESTD